MKRFNIFLTILYLAIFRERNPRMMAEATPNVDPGRCDSTTRGNKVIVVDNFGNDRVLFCVRRNGDFAWVALDNIPTSGEIFDPAKDCSDIVQKRRSAKDGYYWIKSSPLVKATKVWCDLTTDGGGFMLVGYKNSPTSWTLPSNSKVVSPNGEPHWSSLFGKVSMLEFRIQVSITKNPKEAKGDWLYRFKTPRHLTELLINDTGCEHEFPGVGNIEYVKDILAKKIVTRTFQCSRFGPTYAGALGWKRMNQCLRQTCKKGYAIIPGIDLHYDIFGSFSYTTSSNRSGIRHDSTAFIGCDHGKCCACFGPKGATGHFCAPKCRGINGGTVSKKAHAWFWIRSSVPEKPFMKKCMEYVIKTDQGTLSTYFIDAKTGILRKGSCGTKDVANLIDGVVEVPDRESLEKVPLVQGLMSYREDNRKLYVTNGKDWEALGKEKQMKVVENKLSYELNRTIRTANADLKKEMNILKKEVKNVEEQLKKQITNVDSNLEKKIKASEERLKKLTANERKALEKRLKKFIFKSCADWYKDGNRTDGIYEITPDNQGSFKVRCDMTTNGGGWTVFQRRLDGSVNFYRGWSDYKNGFGNLNGEFWLGLDKLHRLSKAGLNVLRVDLEDFSNQKRYAQYGKFSVSGGSDKYRLTVGSYSGNAGDSLAYHNNMRFTTKDADNDQNSSSNCAVQFSGAWWYKNCYISNLNGQYLGSGKTSNNGVKWNYNSMKKTEMKIRPSQF